MSEAPTYSVNVIAKLFGITPRRVQQLSAEGIVPKTERGQYELASAVRGYVTYLQDQVAKAQSGGTDLTLERARLVKARADLVEMDAAQRRGSLIAADSIEAAWVEVLALLRTHLLAIPDRLAPVVILQATPAAARDVLKQAIRSALEELASFHVVAAEGDRDGDAEADAAAFAEELGSASGPDDQ